MNDGFDATITLLIIDKENSNLAFLFSSQICFQDIWMRSNISFSNRSMNNRFWYFQSLCQQSYKLFDDAAEGLWFDLNWIQLSSAHIVYQLGEKSRRNTTCSMNHLLHTIFETQMYYVLKIISQLLKTLSFLVHYHDFLEAKSCR